MSLKAFVVVLALQVLAGVCDAKSSRIAGGEVAALGQFPWHAHIMSNSQWFQLMCGGGLIKPKWVLTAALCLFDAKDVTLYFGMVDRLSVEIGYVVQVRDKEHMFLHPDYDAFNYEEPFNDNIGLIYLNIDDNLVDIAGVALIPLPTNYVNEDFLGVDATATGFGVTDDPPIATSQHLRFVSMPILSNSICNDAHNGTVNERKICTDTTGGRSTCAGDFGAPLVTQRDGQQVLIGIGNLKYMNGCTLGQPGVFTRVTSYLDWIEDVTEQPPTDGDRDCVCDCLCFTCDAKEQRHEL